MTYKKTKAAKQFTAFVISSGSDQTFQLRKEQIYSQMPSLTAMVNPLLAGTSKCVPDA
jgi:hypothetical protein